MLAALLQNNNNSRQQSGFKVDVRASAGRSHHASVDSERAPTGSSYDAPTGSSYDIADILAAAAVFPEIAHEDPVTRAARRLRWISEALPYVKKTRENREAAAFTAGIQLGAATVRAEFAAADKLSLEQLIKIIDEVRATPAKKEPAPLQVPQGRGEERGSNFSGAVIALGLVLGGVLIGSRLFSDQRRKRQ